MRELQITPHDEGQRLDRFLQRQLPEAGKGFFYKMLRKKNITLNGKKAEGNERLRAGDTVRLFFSEETLQKLGHSGTGRPGIPDPAAAQQAAVFLRDKGGETSYARSVQKAVEGMENNGGYFFLSEHPDRVILETEDLLIIDKPAGVLSQKAEPGDISLVEMVRTYLAGKGELTEESGRSYMPGVVNRLDRNTSGLVIAAKTLPAARELSACLKERTLEKYYYALVKGSISEDERTDAWLVKDEKTRKVTVSRDAVPGAAHIQTAWKILARGRDCTLLEVHLITGKTHQIRAHLAFIGHPLAGDVKYGFGTWNAELRRTTGLDRPFLHACRLRFPDHLPYLKEMEGREVEAPLPEGLRRTMQSLGMGRDALTASRT